MRKYVSLKRTITKTIEIMGVYADKSSRQKTKGNNTATVYKKVEQNATTFQFKDKRPSAAVQQKQIAILDSSTVESPITLQRKTNRTGLPDNLKSGIENLSGYAMDDVKVHYNSAKPAQLHAHAYAQGTDIHLGAGQEKHLPHEAWHVVQQKQGRVKPTLQMKGKININDDVGLEKEADVMGARALNSEEIPLQHTTNGMSTVHGTIIQGAFDAHFDIREPGGGAPDQTWTVEDIFVDGDRPGVGVAAQGIVNGRQPETLAAAAHNDLALRHVIPWATLKQDLANLGGQGNTLLQVAQYINGNWPTTSDIINEWTSLNVNDPRLVERYAKLWVQARHDDPSNLFWGNAADNMGLGDVYDNPNEASGIQQGDPGSAFTINEKRALITTQIAQFGIHAGSVFPLQNNNLAFSTWIAGSLTPTQINNVTHTNTFNDVVSKLSWKDMFRRLRLPDIYNQ